MGAYTKYTCILIGISSTYSNQKNPKISKKSTLKQVGFFMSSFDTSCQENRLVNNQSDNTKHNPICFICLFYTEIIPNFCG